MFFQDDYFSNQGIYKHTLNKRITKFSKVCVVLPVLFNLALQTPTKTDEFVSSGFEGKR